MSKYVIDNDTLVSIADAIRSKDGTTDAILVSQMPDRIQAIPQEGGGVELPDEAFVISGNCQYRLSYDGWNWYIDLFGDKITTKNLTNISNMFTQSSTLAEIPFDLNITTECKAMDYLFSGCGNLTSVPRIVGTLSAPTSNYGGNASFSYFFNGCYKLREIPYDYFTSFGGDNFWTESQKYSGGNRGYIFQYCYSLRDLPDISMLPNTYGYYGCLYYGMCYNCYALNGIDNLPVIDVAFTSNSFSNTFVRCSRLKSLTFQTNEDGSPIVVNWKSQVIDLSQHVGYAQDAYHIIQFNSGITTATQITDDATYQALKDNPDSWCAGYGYSRYNHDSAVETINSLPDVSGSGGTNTIKFKGASGELTDGGAISTLTEEEIAVAATKGWTVTLS